MPAGGKGDIVNVYGHFGIAWIMALFEGTVAFVMISASMKSMDPALEESARVMGASKLRTMLTVTLPLVMPGVLGATLFVFAEMLGSFAAALVIGIPARIYVITTAIWDSTLSYPPDYGRASAMGLSLFVVMFGMLTFYRWRINKGSYATITGKAFRPRPMDMGRLDLGAARRLPALRRARGGAAAGRPDPDVAAALRDGDPEPGRMDDRQLPDRAGARADPRRDRQQPAARLRRRLHRRDPDGAAGLDHLPLAHQGRAARSSTW